MACNISMCRQPLSNLCSRCLVLGDNNNNNIIWLSHYNFIHNRVHLHNQMVFVWQNEYYICNEMKYIYLFGWCAHATVAAGWCCCFVFCKHCWYNKDICVASEREEPLTKCFAIVYDFDSRQTNSLFIVWRERGIRRKKSLFQKYDFNLMVATFSMLVSFWRCSIALYMCIFRPNNTVINVLYAIVVANLIAGTWFNIEISYAEHFIAQENVAYRRILIIIIAHIINILIAMASTYPRENCIKFQQISFADNTDWLYVANAKFQLNSTKYFALFRCWRWWATQMNVERVPLLLKYRHGAWNISR